VNLSLISRLFQKLINAVPDKYWDH